MLQNTVDDNCNFSLFIRSITTQYTQSKEGASMRKCARREARAKQRFQGQT